MGTKMLPNVGMQHSGELDMTQFLYLTNGNKQTGLMGFLHKLNDVICHSIPVDDGYYYDD